MSQYIRRCKRIMKQYGKHIKQFDKRLDEPIVNKELENMYKKYNLQFERRIELSWFAKRCKNITCYKDLQNAIKNE